MEQTKQRRSLLERAFGRTMPWLSWVWVALAVVWIVFAFVKPSGFHTFMAIAWSVITVVRFLGDHATRRQERAREQDAASEPIAH